VYAAHGRYRESVDTCLKVREQLDGVSFLPYLLGTLGFAYASSGNPEAAQEVLGELRRLEARGAVTAHERAVVATALGDWDAAIRELETAYEQRTGFAVFVPVEPLFDALRARGLLAGVAAFT
jgi:tetratricopeptide (TPR) repeat protein